MKFLVSLLISVTLVAGAQAKDKDKSEASYEVTAAQAFELMAAHERGLIAQIQLNIAQQNFADVKAKIRKANGWPDDVDFSEQQLKFVKPPAPAPAKPEDKNPN